eukprot:TRINITY_DN27481_c0_g1_i1.p1 TRINITY_DN27481_c0_g1~~TRINITY_DN27481_c0_g1_i1.p1  ORF type:complete len:309 (+),score=126.11 TRINITY_DN27481_c0_g1_i1:90-929(+)
MSSDISMYVRKAEKIAAEMGAMKDEDERPEIDTSKMSAWEKQRFEITLLISQVREDTRSLDEVDASKTTERARTSNRIRQNIKKMKSKCNDEKVLKAAKREGGQQDFDDMCKHVRNAENFFRQKYTGGDASPTMGEGTPIARDYTSIAEYGGTDNDGDGEGGMLNPYEEEEFQQFFDQAQMRDQQIDKCFGMVSQGLGVLKEQTIATGQELERQNEMLDRTNQKAEKVSGDLGKLNKKLHETLQELDKEKYCCYIICLLLFLGIMGVLLTQTGVFRKSK